MQRACGCCREHKAPRTGHNGLPTRPIVGHIVESRLRQAWLRCRALEEARQPWSEPLRSLRTRIVGCCSKSGSFKLVRGGERVVWPSPPSLLQMSHGLPDFKIKFDWCAHLYADKNVNQCDKDPSKVVFDRNLAM